MTNIQAAIGVAQLKKIEEILELKKKIYQTYKEGLKGLVKFQEIIENTESSNWMCSVFFNSKQEKEKIVNVLNKNNIETRPFFIPITDLPFYKKSNSCLVTKEVSVLGLNLPSYPELTKEELYRIITIIKNNIK